MAHLPKKACVFLILLATPVPVPAQMDKHPVSVSGVVLAEGHNQRIQHVVVRLCDGGGNLLEQATTSDSGEFSFRGLGRSRYILIFEANGYRKTQIDLDLSFMSDRGMTVYLRPVENESPSTPGGSSVSAHELSMPPAARSLVETGKKRMYFEKNPQGGLNDFQQAVSKAPGYYEAYNEIAMAYLTLGKPDEAMKSFRKAVEVSGDRYGDAQIGLGTLLIEKGEADAGEKALQRGVELNPRSWRGFYELGKLEFARDQVDRALKSAQRAQAVAPNVPITYRLLANIHLRQKNYRALLDDLDAYIRLDPDSAAGLRAARMREEIAQQAGKETQSAPSESKPQ
jgi:tetratricopeptide (TPR) repeat protein